MSPISHISQQSGQIIICFSVITHHPLHTYRTTISATHHTLSYLRTARALVHFGVTVCVVDVVVQLVVQCVEVDV